MSFVDPSGQDTVSCTVVIENDGSGSYTCEFEDDGSDDLTITVVVENADGDELGKSASVYRDADFREVSRRGLEDYIGNSVEAYADLASPDFTRAAKKI